MLITAYNGEWVHPNIELLALNFDEDELGNLVGPIVKLDIEFKDGKQFRVIVLTSTDGVEDMINVDELENYIEMLIVELGEDVWCPGNYRPFIFTKYGETFNENYSIFTEKYKVNVSSDITLNHDEVDWCWDT